jgi:hypothetical protein
MLVQSSKDQLVHHPMYSQMSTLQDIHIFMESHVYAVWDFMSLLKSLQRDLTGMSHPWRPVGSPTTRFFINEIVLGEESDVHPDGGYISHFELYLLAMEQCGANTQPVRNFIEQIQQGVDVNTAMKNAQVPAESREFVEATMQCIANKTLHERAALFTFGREDLIPGMFISMVEQLKSNGANVDMFVYYLKRHIELDGDHHGQLSTQMTQELVAGDPQKQSEVDAIIEWGYQQRLKLWDGISNRINQIRQN